MSYAQDAKDELVGRVPKARHCRIAELAGMFAFGGSLLGTEDDRIVIFHSENEGGESRHGRPERSDSRGIPYGDQIRRESGPRDQS